MTLTHQQQKQIGGTIPPIRAVSQLEVKIREILRKEDRVPASVGSTLVQVNKWLVSLRENGILASRIAAKAELQNGSDLVEKLAQAVIGNSGEFEAQLRSKSLQEALYYCSGFDPETDYSKFKTRFKRYLDRHTIEEFIQRFLSLYFFNFVWFHLSQHFQMQTTTSESFTKSMQNVEHICQRAVSAAWNSIDYKKAQLDGTTARKLVRTIEQSLLGR